jgi:hypothetical protein
MVRVIKAMTPPYAPANLPTLFRSIADIAASIAAQALRQATAHKNTSRFPALGQSRQDFAVPEFDCRPVSPPRGGDVELIGQELPRGLSTSRPCDTMPIL